ncbi:hypothetical protein T265_00407 [Opisthorchis viverrini]|uniref:Uncharacterized protein n=1 Tax=Opisthorchis viverrini TaxID=6198 RepID=A0A075AJP0_OPIVI|nr:hypothetical protein T265_00407 [Opisthorchis viverrini]KER33719.1 hypothetical protein T265_00407 [Opisthorchis viverrini]
MWAEGRKDMDAFERARGHKHTLIVSGRSAAATTTAAAGEVSFSVGRIKETKEPSLNFGSCHFLAWR